MFKNSLDVETPHPSGSGARPSGRGVLSALLTSELARDVELTVMLVPVEHVASHSVTFIRADERRHHVGECHVSHHEGEGEFLLTFAELYRQLDPKDISVSKISGHTLPETATYSG